jgi:CRISPR system Cascade subunit CasD
LNAILSTRDYRQNGAWLIAVRAQPGAPHSLVALADALHSPRFVLYLGRKSCPPGAPLWPQVMESDSVLQAFKAYLLKIRESLLEVQTRNEWTFSPLPEPGKIVRLSWGEGIEAGVSPMLSVPRKDRLICRRGWHFGDRREYRADLPAEEEETCLSI